MPKIAIEPILLVDVLLKISTTGAGAAEVGDFEAHVSQVQFDPTFATQTWRGMTPTSVHNFAGRAAWACALGLAQDWETANSLSRFLHDHEGETIAVVFEPKAGGASFAADLIVVPGAIGGQGEAVATSSVTLPSTRPVYAAA